MFGVNLDPATKLKLNGEPIYDSEVCIVITKVNPTLNMDKSKFSLNDQFKLGIFGLSVRYLSKGGQKGVSVKKLTTKCMININADKSTLDTTMQLSIRLSENPSLDQRF